MNMPPPPAARKYANNSSVITTCLQSIANESMRKATKELRTPERLNESNGTEPMNCGASYDGTWQKRGFSSRDGCVTAISINTGKRLDVQAFRQKRKQCELHEHLDKNSENYRRRRAHHNTCKANFKGSAPAIETESVGHNFRQSVDLHNLQYTEY